MAFDVEAEPTAVAVLACEADGAAQAEVGLAQFGIVGCRGYLVEAEMGGGGSDGICHAACR